MHAQIMDTQENRRYAKQIALQHVGIQGQARLKQGRILVVGAGGLGCPALLQLAAAGVGYLCVVDGDKVELSNLPRQTLFTAEDEGENKALIAAQRIKKINPHTCLTAHPVFLDETNIHSLLKGCSIVLDASDRSETRRLLSSYCAQKGLAHIYGAVEGFLGQIAVFNIGGKQKDTSSYIDLFPHAPNNAKNCTETGILGMIPCAIGTLQALETLKLLLGHPSPLHSHLLQIDYLSYEQKLIKLPSHKTEGQVYKLHTISHEDKTLSQHQLLQLLQKPPFPLFIDARSLPPSIEALQTSLTRQPEDRPLILHCQKGHKSGLIARQLKAYFPEREIYYLGEEKK